MYTTSSKVNDFGQNQSINRKNAKYADQRLHLVYIIRNGRIATEGSHSQLAIQSRILARNSESVSKSVFNIFHRMPPTIWDE